MEPKPIKNHKVKVYSEFEPDKPKLLKNLEKIINENYPKKPEQEIKYIEQE